MNILFIILLSMSLFAGVCEDTWKKENSENPVVDSCRLELEGHGIELVKLKQGCAFPTPEATDCYLIRSCDSAKEIGASLFRKDVPLDSYCLTGKENEVMGSSQKDGPKAFITCFAKKNPEGIKLVSGTKTKNCPFPFKGK